MVLWRRTWVGVERAKEANDFMGEPSARLGSRPRPTREVIRAKHMELGNAGSPDGKPGLP